MKLDTKPVNTTKFKNVRTKLKQTAFIDLNRETVINVCYSNGDYKRYKGFRVLGIDGSKLLLPNTKEVIKKFGQTYYRSDEKFPKGYHAYGMASVMYDVLNKIAINSVLGPSRADEVNLAVKHLEYMQKKDLLLCDSEYPLYPFLSTLVDKKRQFIIRCSSKSFAAARAMLRGKGTDSQIITLKAHHSRLKEIEELELPLEITVRFIRITLITGEYEILVTSLIDEDIWPTTEFKEIYWLRCIEGFYNILNTRLNLKNFTGKTAESVYQDFYAIVYLTGMESILTTDANAELAKNSVCYPQQSNHISFNTIKNKAVDILFSKGDTDSNLEKLYRLFLINPSISKEKILQQKNSFRKLLDYWKRRQKHFF